MQYWLYCSTLFRNWLYLSFSTNITNLFRIKIWSSAKNYAIINAILTVLLDVVELLVKIDKIIGLFCKRALWKNLINIIRLKCFVFCAVTSPTQNTKHFSLIPKRHISRASVGKNRLNYRSLLPKSPDQYYQAEMFCVLCGTWNSSQEAYQQGFGW